MAVLGSRAQGSQRWHWYTDVLEPARNRDICLEATISPGNAEWSATSPHTRDAITKLRYELSRSNPRAPRCRGHTRVEQCVSCVEKEHISRRGADCSESRIAIAVELRLMGSACPTPRTCTGCTDSSRMALLLVVGASGRRDARSS